MGSHHEVRCKCVFVHLFLAECAYAHRLHIRLFMMVCSMYLQCSSAFTPQARKTERRGQVSYQGTMNNTDPPESSSGLTHTSYTRTQLYCGERKNIPAWGLNEVWQAHLPFSETNAQLWQPWQPWIVVPTLPLDLLHPSDSATQCILAGCELHLSQICHKLIKKWDEMTVSNLTYVHKYTVIYEFLKKIA